MRDLYTTNTSETTTLMKTAYRFTSHAHNNGNVQCTIMVVTGQQQNFQRKWTINLHHTRASKSYSIRNL